MKAFKNALVYTENGGIERCNLLFDRNIVAIGGDVDGAEVIDLPSNAVVLPGFIDEHVHGADGADAMDGTASALGTISAALAREGTTGFLATTMTQSKANIIRALKNVKLCAAENKCIGARLIGAHLEGPFISADYKGAQPLEYIVAPSVDVFKEYYSAAGGLIKIVTLAPEADGAAELIAYLDKIGVVASIGHTAAKYEDVMRAVDSGARNITHTFNAQSAFSHRQANTVGAALTDDRLNCELIADGIHVSPEAMRLLVKCKPSGRIVLITDAIRAKWLKDGESELGGQTVIVKNGSARLKDGTLAGSVLKMNVAVKNMVEKVGVTLEYAVDCASINAAKSLGIQDEAGSIRVGKRADFAVLDPRFEVVRTVVGGETVYSV